MRNPEKRKAAKRAYYLRHGDAIRARRREKRIALRKQLRLTPEELAACQKDPTLAWTIRGTKWIACIEDDCGALCVGLGPHLRQCHHLTARQYKAKPGSDGVSSRYSKNASLSSKDLQAQLSEKRTKLGLGKRLQASGKVPGVKKLIASRGRRVLSQQCRLEQSRRRRKIPDSKILEIIALGLPTAEAAKRAGIAERNFLARAQKLGCDTGASQRQRQRSQRLVFELRKWIALQPQIPTSEQITQHYTDALRSGLLMPSPELLSFIAHLEAELRERPETIAEIRLPSKAAVAVVLTLASRVSQRMRARSAADGPVGADTTRIKELEAKLAVRAKAGAPKKEKPTFVTVGEQWQQILPRFEQGKRLAPGGHVKLRAANFSDLEIECIMESRNPKTAAIRWISKKQGMSFQTGKNYITKFLASKPTRSEPARERTP